MGEKETASNSAGTNWEPPRGRRWHEEDARAGLAAARSSGMTLSRFAREKRRSVRGYFVTTDDVPRTAQASGFRTPGNSKRPSVGNQLMHYNFARIHQTLRVTPAMAAGVTNHVWEIGEIVDLLSA